MGAAEQRALAPAPEGERKKRVRLGIAAFLVVQLVMPLRYYLGDDEYDERFAWRMFSAIRVVECQTSATEELDREHGDAVRPIDLDRVIHPAWINNIRRNRYDVIEAFLARRCEEEGVARVEIANQCVAADGTARDPLKWTRECSSGQSTEPERAP